MHREAKEGERIIVKAGVYKGTIFINKGVELIGEGKPVLDGEGRYQIITVKANRVGHARISYHKPFYPYSDSLYRYNQVSTLPVQHGLSLTW